VYSESTARDTAVAAKLAEELQARRARARRQHQTALLDAYVTGPNFWLGTEPSQVWAGRNVESSQAKTMREIHKQLWSLVLKDDRDDWNSRRLALQAMRRAVLRESVLLRLLPKKRQRDEATWGELLVRAFQTRLPDQGECMVDRIAVFLEDLVAASGELTEEDSARAALYEATKLRDQQFVALVSGETDAKFRERVFAGFNTPLLPEVLICTSVGQEGIDLHRQCRHVVHFDLAWNPAVLEQRTGRVDRIGSETFRERDLNRGPNGPFLDVGVPYLAGTYDERMYEELRLRAQTFEVLTGGDLAADDSDTDVDQELEGHERGLTFVPLPLPMLEDLRVHLHVWSE
jgi:hypothetical protein